MASALAVFKSAITCLLVIVSEAMQARESNLDTIDYHLAKRYGVTSLAAIAVTALVIFFIIRYETIKIIEVASKQSNETLTIATEYTLNDHFVMYLNVVNKSKDRQISKMPFEPVLERVIRKMISDTDVVRIKLYDLSGKEVYSTGRNHKEEHEAISDAFISAREGVPSTTLVYESAFSFLSTGEESNLVQTYAPIRANENTQVLGVMEIYSDISDYIVEANQTTFMLLITICILMAFLYFFLLLHIKKSERIIENQYRDTREKKKLLEYLTSKMITAQEDEKKRIAFDLHEDVVQTLSGVKMQLERYMLSINQIDEDSGAKELSKEIIPVLQQAAHKIRSVAMDLRPPSLDDFGLQAALNSLISECHTVTSGLHITVNIAVAEDLISQNRKSILYRMLKDTLKAICYNDQLLGSADLNLNKTDTQLILSALLKCEMIETKFNNKLPDFFISMQERTILSGGEFIVREIEKDRIEVESVWSE